ncbi:transglutaminase family protein [Salinibacterium sp. ZJ70]|uniref:transglutaminase-like domain-containing protein n=1 Tax=Salinibacterium sp. ZJ70 TaxID=2708084 RepID=UPI00141F226C|nr:transglutaminase domain-containing protein [Salinibacterium sp. ZJ70]
MTDQTARGDRRALPSVRTWFDVAVLLALALLGVIGFTPSYGGFSFLAAGIGGLLVGALTGVLTTMLRMGALLTLATALVAYFVFGPAFAVPGQTIFGVVPTLQSFASVAIGTVYGWADLLTLSTPVGAPVYIAVVPYAATWLVALVSTLLAMRWLATRPRTGWRFAIAIIPAFALYLVGILVGTQEAYQAGVRGIVFAVLVLIWLGWREPVGGVAASADSSLLRRKVAGTAAIAILAAAVGGGAGYWLAPANDQRFVLREEIDPPFDPLDYPSPLAGFRHFSKQVVDDVMFTVDGLQQGDRIRMATLDSFTGKLWNVTGAAASSGGSGSFALVGRSLPPAPLLTPEAQGEIEIEIVGYSDVWLPGVGYPTDFQLLGDDALARSDSLRYNAATGSMVLISGVSEGDRYRAEVVTQQTPTIPELADVPVAAVELPPVSGVPDVVSAKAQEWAGASTSPAEQLEAIRLSLMQGYLSHGRTGEAVSRAGHGADRITDLLERPQMVGDEEQYASAFALMARSLGYPARVVMGFAPDVPEGGGTVSVTGDDVTAWVEVAFEGVGWVPFLPTPEQTDVPQDQVPKPQSEPQPQVRQPPRSDKEPEDLLTPVELEQQDKDEDDLPFVLPGWAYAIGISVLVLLAIVFVPMLIVGLIKARRVRKRRAGPPAHQAAGAWEELEDRYSELGYEVPGRVTRAGAAAALERQLAESGAADSPPLARLAVDVDELVFSGRAVEPAESDAAWSSALDAVAHARGAATSRVRILSRYRIRSARDLATRLVEGSPVTSMRRSAR